MVRQRERELEVSVLPGLKILWSCTSLMRRQVACHEITSMCLHRLQGLQGLPAGLPTRQLQCAVCLDMAGIFIYICRASVSAQPFHLTKGQLLALCWAPLTLSIPVLTSSTRFTRTIVPQGARTLTVGQ